MATPDPTTLTSAAQIFTSNHTLPQIRALHKTLHASLEDTATRLRTQVGGSYRELLGTADMIVAMRVDMEAVQTTLGNMGGRCGRTVVAKKVGGLARFVEEGEREEVGRKARERLLAGVVLGLGGVLRVGGWDPGMSRGERLVAAARLWVLGRLLAKSLGGAGDIERSLESLHRRLLRGVEVVLSRGNESDLLKALAAYSLATSSGARDVLRHFLRVRGQAMALSFEADRDDNERDAGKGTKGVPRCLELYTKTLRDVQSMVPNKLRDVLAALKKDALLVDQSLRGMDGLRLDIYKRWCGDEIQYYTPFIRHDDLEVEQAREMLISWAKEGSSVFLRGLGKTLQGMTEFKAIVELRTRVLKLWIQEGGKAKGFDPSVLLNRIRHTVNGHMLSVLEAKVAKLRLVGSEVAAALDAWREGTTDQHQSLWDGGSFDTDLSNGAAQFTHDVVSRLYGRNNAVSKAVACYQSWYHVIDDVAVVAEQLRRQRWDNDVDEIEDEETIEERQKILSKEDPQELNDHLSVSLVKAFENLDDHLGLLWKSYQQGPSTGHIAMYMLRVLRDIRVRLPQELDAIESFGLRVIPSLHEALVSAVLLTPLDELATTVLAKRAVAGRNLWEGLPELPTSPSPGIFRFLRNVSTSMSDAGGDLWSPTALAVLKKQLRDQVSKTWLESLVAADKVAQAIVNEEKAEDAEAEAELTDGKEQTAEADAGERRRDLFIQWLFDISYLGLFLRGDKSLGDLGDTVLSKTGLDKAAKERLTKSSQEYWKRTSLLFGLLS